MTEATEKDLKDLGAPIGASLCEVCGLQIDPEGGIPPGTCQGWNDAVGHWRLGYERLCRERAAQAAPSNPSDLTSSLTREREENQRLIRALRAAWDELRSELCANCDHAFSEQDYADEDCAPAHHAMELVRTALLTSGASAAQPPKESVSAATALPEEK